MIFKHIDPFVCYFRNNRFNTWYPCIIQQNLKAFLDGATEGFIYVSFGGSIETTELSSEIVRDLSEIFSTLPCKVLWKVKDLYNLTSNIFTSEWLPQQGVLGNINMRDIPKLWPFQWWITWDGSQIHHDSTTSFSFYNFYSSS